MSKDHEGEGEWPCWWAWRPWRSWNFWTIFSLHGFTGLHECLREIWRSSYKFEKISWAFLPNSLFQTWLIFSTFTQTRFCLWRRSAKSLGKEQNGRGCNEAVVEDEGQFFVSKKSDFNSFNWQSRQQRAEATRRTRVWEGGKIMTFARLLLIS